MHKFFIIYFWILLFEIDNVLLQILFISEILDSFIPLQIFSFWCFLALELVPEKNEWKYQ